MVCYHIECRRGGTVRRSIGGMSYVGQIVIPVSLFFSRERLIIQEPCRQWDSPYFGLQGHPCPTYLPTSSVQLCSLNSDSVTKGRTQKLAKTFKIVRTWHDHGTVPLVFLISTILVMNFSQKVLKELKSPFITGSIWPDHPLGCMCTDQANQVATKGSIVVIKVKCLPRDHVHDWYHLFDLVMNLAIENRITTGETKQGLVSWSRRSSDKWSRKVSYWYIPLYEDRNDYGRKRLNFFIIS
jgi:hypothetical protein